jgi:hypothetical protein
MEKLGARLVVIFTGLALILFACVICTWPVQLLWNGCLLTAVDGVHEISFWQALGLNFLFSILFKANVKTAK